VTKGGKMSFQQKNIAVSLGSFILILIIYVTRLLNIYDNGVMEQSSVFRLWGLIIILTIVITIIGTILTHIVSAIVQTVKNGGDEPKIEDIEDERDKLIDLKGIRISYYVSGFGALIAMLSFVIGQPAIIMFSLLILFGLISQIIGDISRMIMYRSGT
jgi:hypothetical protein